MNKTITVFTPTYNRAYVLPRLYESLCRQSSKDFVWLIVDDGSTDNTEHIVSKWIAENIIEIQYYKKDNGGKMRAYNYGVRLCKTPLFACEDSDDYMPDSAVEEICSFWNNNYKGETNIAGMIAYAVMTSKNNECITIRHRFPNRTSGKMCSLYRRDGFSGETFIVFRTEVINKYPFPEIDGEKFITEAVVYERIDKKYDMLYCDKFFSIYEYQPDGYTQNAASLYLKNPKGWAEYYNTLCELWDDEYSLRERIKVLTYYIVFSKIAREKNVFRKSKDKSYRYILAKIVAPYFKTKLLKLLKH